MSLLYTTSVHSLSKQKSRMADAEPVRFATRRDYPSSLTFGLLFYDGLSIAWVALLSFYYALVHTDLYFTDGTSITLANIPFYNFPGLEQSVSQTEKYSFDWFMWASDALRVLPPVLYAIAVKEAVFFRTRSVVMFYAPLLSTLMIVDVFKFLYFSYWLFFQCTDYPYCIQHNPALPHDQAQLSFVFAIIAAAVFVVGQALYLGLGTLIRRAGLPFVRVGNSSSNKQSPTPTPRFTDFVQSEVFAQPTLARRPRATNKPGSPGTARLLPVPKRR